MRSRSPVGWIILLSVLGVLNGCITTKAKYLVRETAALPVTKPDQALVVVYRTSHRAPGSDVEVYAKGKLVGVLQGGTYLHFYAQPGPLTLSAHLGGNAGTITTDVKAGEVVYIEQDFTFVGIVRLEVIAPEEGRSTTSKLKYIELIDGQGG
jgi:hypothetical protein